ncbi:tail fiber protein [Pseudomonas phage vB_PpuP-Kompost-2]
MTHLFKTEHFTILEVTDPVATKDGMINLTVTFEGLGKFPFTASQDDTEIHGLWLHGEALRGTFGPVAEYERPLPTLQDLQEELDKILPDVYLGLATSEEVELAKLLRIQIKAMTA